MGRKFVELLYNSNATDFTRTNILVVLATGSSLHVDTELFTSTTTKKATAFRPCHPDDTPSPALLLYLLVRTLV